MVAPGAAAVTAAPTDEYTADRHEWPELDEDPWAATYSVSLFGWAAAVPAVAPTSHTLVAATADETSVRRIPTDSTIFASFLEGRHWWTTTDSSHIACSRIGAIGNV